MSVIAEYAVRSGKLALADTVDAVPEVGLDIERAYATDPDRPILFVWVTAADVDGFDAALAEDPTIAAAERIDEVDGDYLYRLGIHESTPIVLYAKWVELGGERLRARYEDGWWHARTRFPNREALSEYRRYIRDNDIDFRLERLYDSAYRSTDGPTLTDEQRETLELAYEQGYFEVPRSTTTAELADRLGVSNQAVSERLRRGHARLVEDALR
jgi:predicted DNA binding protein